MAATAWLFDQHRLPAAVSLSGASQYKTIADLNGV
jgi:hypothetical protein